MSDGATDGPLPAAVVRVQLENYRSIERCDVRLGPLTYLVGPNGAGKSNFLDALRLLSDALNSSLEQAVRERGGLEAIRYRGALDTGMTSIEVELRLPIETSVSYRLELELLARGAFQVRREVCEVRRAGLDRVDRFDRHGTNVHSTGPELPVPAAGRLYLTTAASLGAFRMVFDVLSRTGFYNFDPPALRDIQAPDLDDVLDRTGRNAAAVLARLAQEAPDAVRRVEEFLGAVVPGMEAVGTESVGAREVLFFVQRAADGDPSRRFLAQSMSDGTLRAFGVLLALFQQASPDRDLVLVGLEEPEVAVHPAAAAVLRDAIAEAATVRQVLVTTHSPDLLDTPDLDPDSLLAVASVQGHTVISRPDRAGLSAVRDGLFTAGELLRVGQLQPEDGDGER